MLVEQVRTGAVVSATLTVKEQPLVLPLASVTRQLTVVSPRPKSEPEGGVQTNTGLVSVKSLTVVTNVTGVPGSPAHSTKIFVEHVMPGAVVSRTVTVKLHTLVCRSASQAAQLTVVVPRANTDPDA